MKTSEGEYTREKKNIQETVEDKYRDRTAGYIKVSIHEKGEGRGGVENPRRATTKSDSRRSGRVSSRSVALFVNAELRARARVTGSSRKASWGFYGGSSPARRSARIRREARNRAKRRPRRRWMVHREGRTVNLRYRPTRGKFRVALSHQLHTPAPFLCAPVRLAISPPLSPLRCLELPSNLWNDSPNPLSRRYDFTRERTCG